MKKIRVVTIDDQMVVRMGLKFAIGLFKDIELAGEYSHGEGAAKFVAKLTPDVVLLDLRMPDKDGIAVLGEILAYDERAKVVVLTTSASGEDVYRAISMGAKGYVIKDDGLDDIVNSIRAVAAGGSYIPEKVAEIYADRKNLPALTIRERDVLVLIAQGCSNREAAEKLGVSEDAIKSHLKHVYDKINVPDRVGAVRYALKHGLVSL